MSPARGAVLDGGRGAPEAIQGRGEVEEACRAAGADVRDKGQERAGHVAHMDEVAGLEAVAVDHMGAALPEVPGEAGDHTGVGGAGVLAGSVDVEEPERRRGEAVDGVEGAGVVLAAEHVGAVGEMGWGRGSSEQGRSPWSP